jgi:hypothetical protein
MKPKHSCVLSNLQKAGSNNRILYPGCRCLLYLFVKNWSRLLSTHLLQQKFRMQILCIILCPKILSRDNNLLLCYRKSGCKILCMFFLPQNLGQITICLPTHSSDVVIREPSCWPWVAAISWWRKKMMLWSFVSDTQKVMIVLVSCLLQMF